MTTKRIAVVLEGGLVQAVVTDDPALRGIDVFVIDYDTEGCDETELCQVRQSDGGTAAARVYAEGVGTAAIDLKAVDDWLSR